MKDAGAVALFLLAVPIVIAAIGLLVLSVSADLSSSVPPLAVM